MSNSYRTVMIFFITMLIFLLVSAGAAAQDLKDLTQTYLPDISASGSITIIPVDSWSSGSFNQLMSVINPLSPGEIQKLVNIDMDSTATTIYEGDLWFKNSGLSMGLKVDVDDNFIGKFKRFMGYLGYHNFSIRLQSSQLRGTLTWDPEFSVPDMPDRSSFDNSFITVDLLHYPRAKTSEFYYGIGYTSYELPVTLECLVLNAEGEIIYGNAVYQPDMKFSIYSFLFGFDTLQSAFMQVESKMNTGDGFGAWIATQDRFGGGFSTISDEAQMWIENANPARYLFDSRQFTMMVDYSLTIGARWVGNTGPVRLGAGLGYTIGGQTITAVSSAFEPISRMDQVDSSPDLFLFHHGVIFKLSTSW